MSLFDLRGPDFLLFMVIAGGASVVLSVVLKRLVRVPGGALTSAELDALDPYAIAYLLGGAQRVVRAALVALGRRGLVEMNDDELVRCGDAPPYEIAAVGVYRGIPREPDKLHPVEQAVFDQLDEPRSSVAFIAEAVEAPCQQLEDELVARGLFSSVAAHRLHRWLVRLPILVVIALGMIKVGVGVARDRPVFLLVLLLVALGYVTAKMTLKSRSTRRADATIASLTEQNAALKDTAATAPEQVTNGETALAYALFGSIAVGGSLAAMSQFLEMDEMITGAGMASSGWFSGSSSSSFHSCGSSCGSGCGGGCGSGCGGCGGCGWCARGCQTRSGWAGDRRPPG